MEDGEGVWTREYNLLKAELLARTAVLKPSVFPYVDKCPDCLGTGVHLYNPDYPMGDCGAREEEACLTCNERGWLIPTGWTAQSGTSARPKGAGGSSAPLATQPPGSQSTSAHSRDA